MSDSNILLSSLPDLIVLAFTIFGVFMLFSKKRPLYFSIAMFAVVSGTAEFVYNALLYMCSMEDYAFYNLGSLAVSGFYAFMFSANYGQFDSIVDGGQKAYKKARILAFIAPILLLGVSAATIVSSDFGSVLYWIIMVVPLLVMIPCSYFNLKVILMKDDGMNFVKGAKPVNIASLLYIFLQTLSMISSAIGSMQIATIAYYGLALVLIGMVFCILYGRKQWIS